MLKSSVSLPGSAWSIEQAPEHLVIPSGYQHQSVYNFRSRLLGWLWGELCGDCGAVLAVGPNTETHY